MSVLSALKSIRSAADGASGNLAAAGIIGLIGARAWISEIRRVVGGLKKNTRVGITAAVNVRDFAVKNLLGSFSSIATKSGIASSA
ncbi:hypothetical protein [uncultured Roseobacter sp.]|uniref:hypothetical protein n=1 Tax=uncultured Roseobacter sp. TaxID=114847 RepID=UPI0026093DFE|nr:hypothetical protein [uncultured Roseobacter sp.]